jgi:hypothetical protein
MAATRSTGVQRPVAVHPVRWVYVLNEYEKHTIDVEEAVQIICPCTALLSMGGKGRRHDG